MKPRLFLLSLVWCLALSVRAAEPPPRLADQLLSNDPAIRLKAVEVFNKMPSDTKYKMVPDFMVALSSDDPAVRTRAAKILKVLNVKTTEQVPDARQAVKKELSAMPPVKPTTSQLDEIKKEKDQVFGGQDMTSQAAKAHDFDDMKEALLKEKKEAGMLDPSDLKSETGLAGDITNPVVEALRDPDPTMRSRAARRVALLRPPPLEAIPLLSAMLTDKATEVRASAAGALGSYGPAAKSAIPALTRALADEDPGVRQIAADALQQINSDR
jgi:HEAT repeat protein